MRRVIMVGDLKKESNISRTIELSLGILGGVFGLLGGIFAIFMGAFASDLAMLGFSAILASIIGIIGAVLVLKNPKYAGIVLIISGVWLLLSISFAGVIGAVFLVLSGVLAIFRK